MAAIIVQATPSIYAKMLEKSLFISANTYENYIVCKDYCIAHQDDTKCVLPASKYHNILLGEYEEFLHKVDTVCFTY